MSDVEILAIAVGVAAVAIAAVSAWLEVRVERRSEPIHRRVLRQTRAYRDHFVRRRRG